MKDLIESIIEIVKALTGLEISRTYLPYIIVFLTVGPFCTWMYLSIRRWRGDFRAISGEMQAAVNFISHDTRTELTSLYAKFEGLHHDLKGTIVGRLEALQTLMKSTEEVSGEVDSEVGEDDKSEAIATRRTRLTLAEQVRNAVVAKWLEGRPLVQVSINCFQFVGTTESGLAVRLVFQTPYRPTVATDGRLPFTLEVWIDGYKHMNFEWDSDGKYRLRGFKKGDWIAEVAQWQFPIGQLQQEAA